MLFMSNGTADTHTGALSLSLGDSSLRLMDCQYLSPCPPLGMESINKFQRNETDKLNEDCDLLGPATTIQCSAD